VDHSIFMRLYWSPKELRVWVIWDQSWLGGRVGGKNEKSLWHQKEHEPHQNKSRQRKKNCEEPDKIKTSLFPPPKECSGFFVVRPDEDVVGCVGFDT